MTDPVEVPLNPDPPRPPGVPRLEDLDVPEPDVLRESRRVQDVREDAGAIEPPD